LLAVCVIAMLAPAARGEVVFAGVAAGDPSSTDAILWTRAENGGSTTSLTAQIATDQGFANIVATVGGTTASDSEFTLKLLASGLAANTRYYYRFLAPSGVVSPTGQFATAPAPNQRAAVKSASAATPTGTSGLIPRSPTSRPRSSISLSFSATRFTKPRAPAHPLFL